MYTLEFLFDDTLSFILPDEFETIYNTSTLMQRQKYVSLLYPDI